MIVICILKQLTAIVMMWVLGHMHMNVMIMKKMEAVQLCETQEELWFMQII